MIDRIAFSPSRRPLLARMRFLRCDGVEAKVGTSINLIKDVSIEASIRRRINHLLKCNLLTANGNRHDPPRSYRLVV